MSSHVKAANSTADTLQAMMAATKFEITRKPDDSAQTDGARTTYDDCQQNLVAEVKDRYNSSTALGSDCKRFHASSIEVCELSRQ